MDHSSALCTIPYGTSKKAGEKRKTESESGGKHTGDPSGLVIANLFIIFIIFVGDVVLHDVVLRVIRVILVYRLRI